MPNTRSSPPAGQLSKLIFILLLLMGEAHAMGKLYLFSAVEGVVVQDGKPVAGAIIEQDYRWAWKNEVGHQQTTTDKAGKFSLAAVIANSLFGSLLPHEPMIRQTLRIRYQDEVYQAWLFDKGNYAENGELDGKPISLYCELSEPMSHNGEVFGICLLAQHSDD